MGLRLTYRVDDRAIARVMQQLKKMGERPGDLMRDIATLGENSTRERFATETAPDGSRWPISLRAKMTGGRTLTKDGHLGDSITSSHGDDFAEWGTNIRYARIHQQGGIIRAVNAKYLQFSLPGGGFASVKQVTIPARPFLGISNEDRADINAMARRHLERALAQ